MKGTFMKFQLMTFVAVGALLAGCSGGSGSSDTTTTTVIGTDTTTTVNTAPVVNAGADLTADFGDTIAIDATVTDVDATDTLTFSWTETTDVGVTLDSTDTEDTSFTAPATASTITLQLSVSDGSVTTTDDVTIAVTDGTVSSAPSSWIINTTERSTEIFETSAQTLGVLEDVQVAETQTVDGVDFTYVETEGIPNFDLVINQDDIDALNDRPRASTDFTTGVTTISVGDTVAFGQNIGYVEETREVQNCVVTGGVGYWPPGPACPVMQGRQGFFSQSPSLRDEETDGECETGIGTLGYLVNGAAIFGWGDTNSFDGAGDWQNLAVVFEEFDLDVCLGHSAGGDYHLHNYGRCLRDQLGDDGTDHSPVIGFAADGFPVYGPYEAADTFALSGWAARDYDDPNSATGCGVAGERTCELVDRYDLSAGIVDTPSDGPTTSETVSSLSGNSIIAASGAYFEDYYYTGATVTGAQLDANNGHDTNDGRGYHYHFTQTIENGVTELVFPYTFGPRYSGIIPDNAVAQCGSSDQSNGGGPGGGPGG